MPDQKKHHSIDHVSKRGIGAEELTTAAASRAIGPCRNAVMRDRQLRSLDAMAVRLHIAIYAV